MTARDGSLRLDDATVMLRPLGSSLPLGFAGLTIASLLVTGLDLGWIAASQRHQVAIAILASAVPLQTVSFLFALPARDGAAATATSLLVAAWASTCAIWLFSPPGVTSSVLGLALAVIGALLLLSTPAQAIGKPLPALAYGLAGARFVVSGIYELSAATGWQDASGALGIAVAAVAAYTVIAFELEDARDASLLPTFRRGRGRRALVASADDQLAGLQHEAGVRQQL